MVDIYWVWTRFHLVQSRQDLPGGDIGTVKTTDFNECAKTCMNRSECIGYTEDRWNGLCYLKGEQALNSAYSLHPKANTQMRPEYAGRIPHDSSPVVVKGRKGKGFDREGYETLLTNSFEICAAACVEDSECQAVNYRESNRSCQKIAYPDEYFTMEGVEMGIKVQVRLRHTNFLFPIKRPICAP